MEQVKSLISEIKTNLSQTSASQKDEVRVMRAMLNDTSYKVDIYEKEGKVGEYCPAEDARKMITSVIASAAKVPTAEAEQMASAHEFKKSEAETFINISKEFTNTYIQTGRKLPLGGRATSDVALSEKHVDATDRPYPKKTGVDQEGKDIYIKAIAKVPAHDSVKVYSPCPAWINK
jgi:hypothetical protein